MAPVPPRVILLIDVFKGVQDVTALLPNLHLTCLRLLSYYAHNSEIDETKAALLWGYKFFNSTKQSFKGNYKQYAFLDFTTQSFDIFEKDLFRIFQEKIEDPDDVLPGKKMQTVFTELLSDFHWERPELFSPSKHNRRIQDDEVRNFVYMFSPAPKDRQKMMSYFDKGKLTKQKDFMKLLFPKSLYSKFICELKIRLFWMDTNLQNNNDMEVVNFLKRSLLSVNGSLLHFSTFSSWWMYYQTKSNTESFVDILNTSSLFEASTSTGASEAIQNINYCIFFSNEGSCMISISPLHKNNFSNDMLKFNSNIRFDGLLKKEEISPLLLDPNHTFYYVLVFHKEIADDKTVISKYFDEALEEKKAMKISWIPPGASLEYNSILIPSTRRIGTILTLKSVPEYNQEQKSANNVVSFALSKRLAGGWDFGTSLVHCVDSWFTSNMNLGMKTSSKNVLRKLCKEEIIKRQKQEGNSKELLKVLKKSLKGDQEAEEDTSGKPPPKKVSKPKKKNFKGISWVRWRLLEYQKKKNEEKGNSSTITSEAANENKQQSTTKEESEKPLEVEEFKCQEDLRVYLDEEWNFMEKQSTILQRYMHRFVMSAVQFFSNIDEKTCQEMGVNFIKKHFHQTVGEIRENREKEQLVFQYLLQVQLLLECATAVKHDCTDVQESYCNQIVVFLRSVTFEESPSFVQNHLKIIVTPHFSERNKTLLQSIYEDLMFDIPECLERSTNSDEEENSVNDSPVKSFPFQSSIGEYQSDDFSSVGSYQSERRSLRRIPSVVGENTNKRMITVQAKRTKATTKSKRKIESRSQSREKSSVDFSEKNGRNSLFDVTFKPPEAPKTPTFKRRYSEILLRKHIPETPEGKQKNDLIWKKQDLNRRVSKVDKNMKPIKESPMKEISSQKRRSLCRSYSFSCRRSSPSRFYAVRRIQPTGANVEDKTEADCGTLKSFSENLMDPLKVRNILFSNFDDRDRVVTNDKMNSATNSDINLKKYDSGVAEQNTETKDDNSQTSAASAEDDMRASTGAVAPRKRTRRNIFNLQRTSSDTSGTDSISFDSSQLVGTLKRRRSSVDGETFRKRRRLSTIGNSSSQASKLISEVPCGNTQLRLDVDSTTSKFQFGSDITMDWLTEIEQNQSNVISESVTDLSFREAFEKLSKASAENENTRSPCLRHAMDKYDSPTSLKQSPTIVRTGNESIRISPLLSATSLDLLEKAPILSPVGTNRKSHKRRTLNSEYNDE